MSAHGPKRRSTVPYINTYHGTAQEQLYLHKPYIQFFWFRIAGVSRFTQINWTPNHLNTLVGLSYKYLLGLKGNKFWILVLRGGL